MCESATVRCETEKERDVANRNDAVTGGVEKESERDGEEAFRWNGDGTRPFPRSERDIERGTSARICRRCSLTRGGNEQRQKRLVIVRGTRAAFSTTWRKEGRRKIPGNEARSEMQMRAGERGMRGAKGREENLFGLEKLYGLGQRY